MLEGSVEVLDFGVFEGEQSVDDVVGDLTGKGMMFAVVAEIDLITNWYFVSVGDSKVAYFGSRETFEKWKKMKNQ